jgi:4-carboxymuconolactone decarboxylase
VRLSVLAILVTARVWNQQVEWAIHAPIAAQVGVPPRVIAAIAQRRRADDMLVDESVVYDFCVELHRHKRVSDRTYNDALALFGEHGVVDLMGINGYYTFLAMVMNTAQTEVPPSIAAPMPD